MGRGTVCRVGRCPVGLQGGDDLRLGRGVVGGGGRGW